MTTNANTPETPAEDEFEALLADCIARHAEGGPAAVDAFCDEHPANSGRLRARLAQLEELGLLDEGDRTLPRSFGAHRVIRRLGRGGMGVVYLVRDEALGTQVALKLGPETAHGSARRRARFEREVRAAARLEHPSIVRIHGWGEVDGRPFYTMEFVRGATLAHVISELRERGASFGGLRPEDVARVVFDNEEGSEGGVRDERSFDPDAFGRTYVEGVCRVVLDIARALAYAHTQGIVHRDVNPSNIILREDGRAQLFDLGLASVNDSPTITRSGDFAGTPHYVSPEQLTGHTRGVDHRTDVYSLGVSLYELITLRRPYEGRSTGEVLERIRTRDPVPPRRLEPQLPRDLDTICTTAMAREPNARYATMSAFAADLERFLAFKPIEAQPIGALRRAWRTARRRKALSAAAGLAAFVLVALPVLLLWANRIIRDERDRTDVAARAAERRAEEKAAVTDFLVAFFELGASDPDGESVTARELLERGVRDLDARFPDQPLVRAALMEATGRVFRNLALPEEALPWLDRALHLRQRELGEQHPDTAAVVQTLAEVHFLAGRAEDARALWRRGLRALDAAGMGASDAAVRARLGLARSWRVEGRLEPARRELDAALALAGDLMPRSAEGGDGSPQAELALEAAELALACGELASARVEFERALAAFQRSWTPRPGRMERALEGAAQVAAAEGDEAHAAEWRAQLDRLRRVREGQRLSRARSARALVPADYPCRLLSPWQEAFDRSFQAGITALQTDRPEEAARAFEHCLDLNPAHAACAYNLACGLASAGERERALDWLEHAVDLGLGYDDERYVGFQRDVDLLGLREDERWRASLELMGLQRAALASQPAVLRHPSGLAAGVQPGLLVYLHAAGAAGSEALDGELPALSDAFGLVLFAPPAPFPLGSELGHGSRWFEDVEDHLRRPEELASRLLAQVQQLCREHRLDESRIWLVGQDQGALVASDLALRAPGWFDGVVLLDGPPSPSFDEVRARRAASLGLRTRIVLRDAPPPFGGVGGQDAQALARDLVGWLEGRGLAAAADPDLSTALAALAAEPDERED